MNAQTPIGDSKAIGRRIYELRKDKKLSQIQLAERAGLTQQNIADYEAGRPKRPRYLPELAEALGTTVEELRGRKTTSVATAKEAPTQTIPLMGSAAAGRWMEPDLIDEGVRVPRVDHPLWGDHDQYALRADGPSMNKKIPDGSIVTCTPYAQARPTPTSRDIVHAVLKRGQLEEWSIKRLVIRQDAIELWPDSHDPRFQSPIKFDVKSMTQANDKDVTLEIRGLVIDARFVLD